MQPGNTESTWGGVQAMGRFGNQPRAFHLCSGSNCHTSNHSNKAAAAECITPALLSPEGIRDLWEVVGRFLFYLWPFHVPQVDCEGFISWTEEVMAQEDTDYWSIL